MPYNRPKLPSGASTITLNDENYQRGDVYGIYYALTGKLFLMRASRIPICVTGHSVSVLS